MSSAIDRIKDVTIGFLKDLTVKVMRPTDLAHLHCITSGGVIVAASCGVVVSVGYLHSVIVEAQGSSYPNPVGNCWKRLIRLSGNNYYYYYYYCKTQE